MHTAPLDPFLKGKNVKVFSEPNPIAENGELLFLDLVQNHNNTSNTNKDPSGAIFAQMINPYLDAPSNGEQDLSDEEGQSLQLFTPPQDKDTIMEHWDDEHGNEPDSYAYNDYVYQRHDFTFNINTVTDCQQLLVALGSLRSSVEQYMPHSANCVKCKKGTNQDLIELLADSGTSLHFTHEQSNLSEFQEVYDEDFDVQMASKSPPLAVKGVGCMFLTASGSFRTRTEKNYLVVPCLLHTRDQSQILICGNPPESRTDT